jgi:selenocysteine lyase/cysteine desulfurase
MKRSEFLSACVAVGAGGVLLPLPAVAKDPPGLAVQPAAPGPTALRPPAVWPPVDPSDESFWTFLRGQFPLAEDRAYLNTGGLGASPYAVIDAVKAKMDELELVCETGHTEEMWKETKGAAALLLGCDAGEIAFVRNTTEGINIVAQGLPFKSGDEVILTTHEHVGNALTWLALTKQKGIVLRLFEPSTASQAENMDRIAGLINKRTRLISVPHAVTTTGLLLPVKEIAALARTKGIWSFVDGAQTAGMLPFSLHDIGCDAYATSGHKWLMGPKETGLLYVRQSMLETIRPLFVGAYSDGGFDFLKGTVAFHPTAQRYEYGTVSVPLRAGLKSAFSFVERIGIANVWKRDRALSDRLFEGLAAIPRVTVLSPADPSMRSAMVTFMHKGRAHLDLQEHLNAYNLRTRSVTEGGLAALRISTHVYNSFDEVERVLEGVRTA